MLYLPLIISIIEVLMIIVPALLIVAFVTIAERKTMASMQRRLGPNIVGYYGLLQAFADALKLLLKEYISPTQANLVLFFLGPIITLNFSLFGYAVIPYGPGLSILDFNLGILYILAVSSLSTYGILLAGWSANSKYAFLGSLRSTAQLISYELILSSAILLVILLTGSLSLTVNIESQRSIWFVIPLFPIFIIFLLGSIAETNRAPFDLAEAESELVSGFMTEHSAVIFVFFFLAEYASIILICSLICMLFLGGYLFSFYNLVYLIQYVDFDLYIDIIRNKDEINLYYPIPQPVIRAISLSIKTCVMIFVFIWARACFPRIRFDQLMSLCWTILLPLVIAFIILIPCILYSFEIIPSNISLLFIGLPFKKRFFNILKLSYKSIKLFLFKSYNFSNLSFENNSKSNNKIIYNMDFIKTLPSHKQVSRLTLPPFKTIRHKMNMGLKPCDIDNWITLDSSYAYFHKKRRILLKNFKENVIVCLPGSQLACKEVFDNVVHCLTKIYPRLFVLKGIGNDKIICNNMTNESFFLNTNTPLEDASRLAMDDFNILTKDPITGQYHLLASATLFPAGWKLEERIGYPLDKLHGPVPGWKDVFKNALDKFFDKIVEEKMGPKERYNVFVQTTSNLFTREPVNSTQPNPDNIGKKPGFRYKDVFIRREKQTFTLLPQSKTVLFTVRTYIEPITDLDNKELLDFAEGVKLWKSDIAAYKGITCWGPIVEKFINDKFKNDKFKFDNY